MKATDILYEVRHWSRDLFTKVFPEVALAIALHNVDWGYAINKLKIREKDLPLITLRDFPFCYLLILADSLQEWDRPAIARRMLTSTGVLIVFNEIEKRFDVKFALSTGNSNRISTSLRTKLSAADGKHLPQISSVLSEY